MIGRQLPSTMPKSTTLMIKLWNWQWVATKKKIFSLPTYSYINDSDEAGLEIYGKEIDKKFTEILINSNIFSRGVGATFMSDWQKYFAYIAIFSS